MGLEWVITAASATSLVPTSQDSQSCILDDIQLCMTALNTADLILTIQGTTGFQQWVITAASATCTATVYQPLANGNYQIGSSSRSDLSCTTHECNLIDVNITLNSVQAQDPIVTQSSTFMAERQSHESSHMS